MATIVIKDKGKERERTREFDPDRLVSFIRKAASSTGIPESQITEFTEKMVRRIDRYETIEAKSISKLMKQEGLVRTNQIKEDGNVTPESLKSINWNKFSRFILLQELYKRASKNRSYDSSKSYGDFFGLIVSLTEKGLYTKDILEKYSREELIEIGNKIKPERDLLFDFAGLHQLSERYIVRDYDKSILELPQERFMVAALHLMIDEPKEKRLQLVEEGYWAISNHYLTLATPTLMNAGRVNGGLSSCFILTSEDSLRGIYDDNTDAATFSKGGAGIGIYIGKLRAEGSDIRGHKGAAGGTFGWTKQLDNTAVSVDQLGQRPGAIAVYQDIWHRDVTTFMESRLNTGDTRKRAYNIFTGLCIPDEFMRQVDKKGDWYLFDPHEIKTMMGFSLEDFFDNKKLGDKEKPNPVDHAWTYHYYKCVDSNELKKTRISAIEMSKKILQIQLETGIPYMFYRDTVNRDNPNKHEGMIYSSNLCSEIAQNQSPSTVISEKINELDGTVIITKTAGDLVTCNLSSLVLNNIMEDGVLQRVIEIQMRMLDNVISLLKVPVPQAQLTNVRYRAVGAGEQGIAALLASNQIMWDSEEAVGYISKLEEEIMLHTIRASSKLGEEKGSYPLFEGSDWNTGEWFKNRTLTHPDWKEVQEMAQENMRNAYLRAIAPTGGTSVIVGSTAGIDPIFDVIYSERKKDYQLPIVVPNLSPSTWFFYKPTMKMSYGDDNQAAHMWAIRHNEARQPFVDQAISHNFYIPRDVKARTFLDLHLSNWKAGVKTSYYTRNWDSKQEDSCLACSS
jgi:ribonucleoside-diphosphate reductase alpha chain